MNYRLDTILSMINRNTRGVADVGTDHGYIPVCLAETGYQGNIIATDLHSLPLRKAEMNAFERGLSDRIQFQLTDGLNGINPADISEIVIAGMGGDLICRILDEAEWVCSGDYHLILQPMSKSEILRYWLFNNGFYIDCETPLLFNGKIEQCISSVFTGKNEKFRAFELYIGKFNVCRDSSLYLKNLDRFRNRLVYILDSYRRASNDNDIMMKYYGGLIESIDSFRSEYNGVKK